MRPATPRRRHTHLTVDTVAPAVAITTIEGGDDLINAAEAAGGITVSGTAEIGSTLTVNGVAVTVDASGGWTTSVAPAGDGPLTVTAVATDAAGNTATATHELTVDTVAPAAPAITSIPENGGGGINASEASDGTPVVVGLTGTGAVAGDTLTINWGGQTVNYTLLATDISGSSATVTVPLATITAQGEGTFNVTATLTDAAGNASADSTATSVTVDTVAPTAPSITSIPENGGRRHQRQRGLGRHAGGGGPDRHRGGGGRHADHQLGRPDGHLDARGGRHLGQQRDGDGAGRDDRGAGRGHVRRDGHADRRSGQRQRELDGDLGDGRHGWRRRWRSPRSRAATT